MDKARSSTHISYKLIVLVPQHERDVVSPEDHIVKVEDEALIGVSGRMQGACGGTHDDTNDAHGEQIPPGIAEQLVPRG